MVLYVHIWSANIILLMFILGAIGYILNQKTQKKIISDQLLKYFNYTLSLAIATGVYMIMVNTYWMTFPKFLMKVSVTIALATLSIVSLRQLDRHNNLRSILIIALFVAVYSMSLLIGSYY